MLELFFELEARKFHFPKYKFKFFLRNYKKFFQNDFFKFFLFFELGFKNAPGSSLYSYCHFTIHGKHAIDFLSLKNSSETTLSLRQYGT